jgi:protein ImuB
MVEPRYTVQLGTELGETGSPFVAMARPAAMHWIALLPETASAAGDDLTDPVLALAWWALRYTPKVARYQNAVLLEVSASARLWGGLAELLQLIFTSKKPVVLVAYAQGATSLIAYAQLVVSPTMGLKEPVVPTTDDLPLQALTATRLHLDTLARLGVRTWGQLRALPRGGVVRRFGAPLLDALDQAYGVRSDSYPWLVLPEVFEASLELTFQVESAPALLFAARRLLAQLKVWLQLRHRGVLGLELIWHMDERRHTATQGALQWRTAVPTQDSAHLQRLLGEHLAHVSLPAPAHTLRLRTLDTQALAHTSASLLPEATATGDSTTQTLERLSARLGRDKVLQLQPRLDHRPEHMQVWQPVGINLIANNQSSTSITGIKLIKKSVLTSHDLRIRWSQALYPTWLLPEPLPLVVRQQRPYYQGLLTLLVGPQRLEAGWWGGGDCVLRDYFVARSRQSVLLWIYRQRLTGAHDSGASEAPCQAADGSARWYLHGFFA